jgi:hypothetical protein
MSMRDAAYEELPKLTIDNAGNTVIAAAGIICVGMIFFATAKIAFGIITALLVTAGGFYVFAESRKTSAVGKYLWHKAMRHKVATDIIVTIGLTFLFGTTDMGLLAGGASGIFFSNAMNFCRKRDPDVIEAEAKLQQEKEDEITIVTDREFSSCSVA